MSTVNHMHIIILPIASNACIVLVMKINHNLLTTYINN